MLVAIDGSESGKHALKESFKLASKEKSWITVACVMPSYEGDLDIIAMGNIQQAMRWPCEKAIEEAAAFAKAERILIKPVLEEGTPHERIIDIAEADNCELIVMGRRGVSRLERALIGSVTARVIGYSQRDVLVVPLHAVIDWTNILVATDGSKHSQFAIERAIDFAASYGGELKILSIVDVPTEFYGEAPDAVEEMVRKAKGHVEKAKAEAEAAGIKAEAFVREGENTHKIILDLASELKINTIVMGSHGRTGLRRLLMGSVAEKVIGYAPCPVLIVKP